MKKTWIMIAAGATLATLAALARKQKAEESAKAPDVCEEADDLEIVPVREAEDTYYWAQKGGVWHSVADCSYLARTSEIQSGSIEAARRAGKIRGCASCADW